MWCVPKWYVLREELAWCLQTILYACKHKLLNVNAYSMYTLILRTDHSHTSTQTLQASVPSGCGGQLAHTFLIGGVKLLLELLSQQPSLYRSVCPFFLSHSLFLAFIPSQLPAFPLSHFYPSVFVCIASSILPSPISFSLSPIWPCFHGDLLFCLSRNAFHKSVSMGNVTRMHSAQLQRGNHLMWPFTWACVTRMRSGPHPS